ncbi:hypothetical protein [Streptomyces sp. MMBL 11-1]|nr:hypothetical protein [Streptomyces sp. MMBL 11-1]
MAARVEQQAPQSDSPARTSEQGRTEVTLTAMSVQLPGWIDQVTVPAGEA